MDVRQLLCLVEIIKMRHRGSGSRSAIYDCLVLGSQHAVLKMSDTGKKDEKDSPKPPPVTGPTQPEAPKDTGGSGKRRGSELDLDGGGDDGQFRRWSLFCC